jgi:hypothetical protein
MKKLIAHELIPNKLEILVDAKGITRFILARRQEEKFGDTHWQLFQGDTHIETSPYRNDLYSKLEDFAVKSA